MRESEERVDRHIFEGDRETAWCPGCGNFAIRSALIHTLSTCNIHPHEVVICSGIGQAAKMPHYLKVNGFNGLHGRALPPAIGLRAANPNLWVIVESGDGDTYGEGGNHFLHTIRRNPNIAHFVHNNRIYGLTKGQASPTTGDDIKRGLPFGSGGTTFNPILSAVAMGASFVARGFAGDKGHLQELMERALLHRGYALVDILQPCVSFNKVNTYQWYRERVYHIEDHDPADFDGALRLAREWGERIPLGVFYQEERPIFLDSFSYLKKNPLERDVRPKEYAYLLEEMK